MFVNWRLDTAKLSIFSNLTYWVNVIPKKISAGLLKEAMVTGLAKHLW
jgi:hypothetical protein